MNEKMTAILLETVMGLKKLKWVPAQDWEVTLKGEGHVPLIKQVMAEGSTDGGPWKDEIETYINLSLTTDDEITFFPEFTIYAHIQIGSIEPRDIAYTVDCDVAFTEKDVRDKEKTALAAQRIDRIVGSHINQEYQDYADQNDEAIRFYKKGISEFQKPS